eukprot:scaffold43683_cov20-Tisochrysis_lutea.AAC.5
MRFEQSGMHSSFHEVAMHSACAGSMYTVTTEIMLLCVCVCVRACVRACVRMAIFSQHHVDGMDLALSPLSAMQRAYPGVKVRAGGGQWMSSVLFKDGCDGLQACCFVGSLGLEMQWMQLLHEVHVTRCNGCNGMGQKGHLRTDGSMQEAVETRNNMRKFSVDIQGHLVCPRTLQQTHMSC